MKKLGKYEILEEIGRGGFAVVYKARDPDLDRFIALKVLHPYWTEDASFVTRFHQEAHAAANLRHPNIVTVYETSEAEGRLYIAMEYLPGRILQDLLEAEGVLSLEQALPILEQLADALDYAHAQGVIHRDVKPSNVVVEETERGMRATLMDFGLVKAMAESTVLTSQGTLLGSPEYMAPEQSDPERAVEVGPATDRYAVGIVTYQMLTGQVPFPGNTPATLNAHLNLEPPDPRTICDDLSPSVATTLRKMLSKSPGDRFASARAFVARLREPVQRERQIREREVQIAPLHEQLQAASVREDWTEVLALGGQIRALDSSYQDVAELMERAKERMHCSRRPSVPAWPWSAGVAGLLILVALGVVLTATKQPPEGHGLSAGDTWTRPVDGMVMVHVPAGGFEMGSDDDDVDYALRLCSEYHRDCERERFEVEQPVHIVALDSFWIDQTEVNNAQYRQCVEAGKCKALTTCGFGEPTYEDPSKADHPVVCVDWYEARAYCEWAGGRLPTEAEWEYAARGPESHSYPWGDDAPNCSKANYQGQDGDCVGGTTAVGTYLTGASWCDALDMAGNVAEWVADWWWTNSYPSGRQVNPAGPSSGDINIKMLRGGCWLTHPWIVRSAYRYGSSPGGTFNYVGFRCAMDSE